MVQQFDAKLERELISQGTHFWRYGCLGAVPIDDRSTKDERYRQSCYEFFVREAEILVERGSSKRPDWWPRGFTQSRPVALPDKQQEDVAKLPKADNLPTAKTESGVLQQKHPGGRPKKTGKVHRATLWRREKEGQGVLL